MEPDTDWCDEQVVTLEGEIQDLHDALEGVQQICDDYEEAMRHAIEILNNGQSITDARLVLENALDG